jgi:hypothetical protein
MYRQNLILFKAFPAKHGNNMKNRNAFAAHLQEQGIASGSIHKRLDCLNPKAMRVYMHVVAHK